jgi:hypothetical protein
MLLTASSLAAAGGRYRQGLKRKKYRALRARQRSKATIFLTVVVVGFKFINNRMKKKDTIRYPLFFYFK